MCGGTPRHTPREALNAGEREVIIELLLGRPGADMSLPLISDARAKQIVDAYERDLHRAHLR